MFNVNWIAILVCGVAFMVIGMVWYSPALFAKKWMKLTGSKMGDPSKMGMTFGLSFVFALVMAFILAKGVYLAQVRDLMGGLKVGGMMWLGFVAPTMAINTLYQGKSRDLFLIDAGFFLVDLLVMGMILALWWR